MMTERENELQLDVSAEDARALHRIVRAMHDGHCPKCGNLEAAEAFVHLESYAGSTWPNGHRCRECDFRTAMQEEDAALKAFQPHLQRSLEVFEQWRQGR